LSDEKKNFERFGRLLFGAEEKRLLIDRQEHSCQPTQTVDTGSGGKLRLPMAAGVDVGTAALWNGRIDSAERTRNVANVRFFCVWTIKCVWTSAQAVISTSKHLAAMISWMTRTWVQYSTNKFSRLLGKLLTNSGKYWPNGAPIQLLSSSLWCCNECGHFGFEIRQDGSTCCLLFCVLNTAHRHAICFGWRDTADISVPLLLSDMQEFRQFSTGSSGTKVSTNSKNVIWIQFDGPIRSAFDGVLHWFCEEHFLLALAGRDLVRLIKNLVLPLTVVMRPLFLARRQVQVSLAARGLQSQLLLAE
jgi:hypothetical protein